jgi:uncharacterized protein
VLIQFRVENHRSLRDEQILSLVAGRDKGSARAIRVPGLSEALVPVAAIYGANASGKSNVLGAFAFMASAVRDSQRVWDVAAVPVDPFRLSSKVREPSLYEVDFLHEELRLRYGFRVSSTRVEEEWLFAWPNGRKATWFERDGDAFSFGKSLRGENEAIRSLTRPNSLFLSAAAQNSHKQLLRVFQQVAGWRFAIPRRGGSARGWPRGSFAQLFADGGGEDRDAVLRLLREADTGIVDVRAEAVERQLELPDQLRLRRGPDRAARISFRHRAATDEHAWLPLDAESTGTLALLELAPAVVSALREGGLLCVDELEASLHPAVAMSVVRLFNDPAHNPAQRPAGVHDA